MTPYKKAGHSATYWLTVRDRHGKAHRLPTGTHDLATAEQMDVMLRALAGRGRRDWDLLAALFERDPSQPTRRRLTLARLYDHWTGRALAVDGTPRTLDDLRAELTDLDLAPRFDEWLQFVERTRSAQTARLYRIRLGRLAPLDAAGAQRLPFLRSHLTPATISTRRDSVPGGVPSQVAHLTAWSSCCTWLIERGLIADNPCGRVKWPAAQRKGDRIRNIARLADVQRFVAAFETLEDRAIAALRESTGADWDGIAGDSPMRREHIVDPARRLVFLPGDKTGNRAREVEVEAWAWVHVAAYLAATPQMPGAPLFTVGYETYLSHHNRTRAALIAAGVGIPAGYSPHNARHSFAVRKRRAGWPDWKIAEYLGNTAQQVAEVYGRFRPTRDDLRQDRAGGDER